MLPNENTIYKFERIVQEDYRVCCLRNAGGKPFNLLIHLWIENIILILILFMEMHYVDLSEDIPRGK